MDNNDIFRRLRYILNLNDKGMSDLLAVDGYKAKPFEVEDMLKTEDEDGFAECSDKVLTHLLDAFILRNRGPRESGKPPVISLTLNNNLILKKLRIALEFKEDDMIKTFAKADFHISKPELSALFRKKGHKHYQDCGDQLLRRFLKGLSIKN